jgi:quercetin dioxygenase-like cupin family protein
MFAKISWNRKLQLATLAVLAVLVVSLFSVNITKATPPQGVTPEPIAAGQLPSTFNTIFVDMESGKGGVFKQVRSDVDQIVMIKFTVAPGGHFGWHQHGGPLWVVVASGTLGYYSADDPTCTPVIFEAGSAFMDPGNVTHTARNEGADNVVIYVTFMLPEGGLPRIDADHPGICDFLP